MTEQKRIWKVEHDGKPALTDRWRKRVMVFGTEAQRQALLDGEYSDYQVIDGEPNVTEELESL